MPMAMDVSGQVDGKQGELEIDKILRAIVKLKGSDLHLKVGRPPFIRVAGNFRSRSIGPPLTAKK